MSSLVYLFYSSSPPLTKLSVSFIYTTITIYNSMSSSTISCIASSTTFTHSSVCFFISSPQKRITVHPSNNNLLFTSSSLSLLRDILLIQNSLLLLFSSLGLILPSPFHGKILRHRKLLSYILSAQYHGFPGNIFIIFPVTISFCPQSFSKDNFNFSIFSMNIFHVFMSLFFS